MHLNPRQEEEGNKKPRSRAGLTSSLPPLDLKHHPDGPQPCFPLAEVTSALGACDTSSPNVTVLQASQSRQDIGSGGELERPPCNPMEMTTSKRGQNTEARAGMSGTCVGVRRLWFICFIKSQLGSRNLCV